MSKEKIITGVKISQQMSAARNILLNQVIPKERKFQKRKGADSLSPALLSALKANA